MVTFKVKNDPRLVYIDDEDADKVLPLKWTKSRGKVYRNLPKDGVITNRLLSRFVLGIEDTAILVSHKDGNTFNCQKSNLIAYRNTFDKNPIHAKRVKVDYGRLYGEETTSPFNDKKEGE